MHGYFCTEWGGPILFVAMLDADDAECGAFDAQRSWKWSYRKRRSIHDRTLRRETLIALGRCRQPALPGVQGRWSRRPVGLPSEAKLLNGE
ncbi:hypothetical protein BN844_5181 [Pseudomonas sp. SHC52]|nr:hypothetical protein BN844_5181 [Pseudomonas sp. SHC52]